MFTSPGGALRQLSGCVAVLVHTYSRVGTRDRELGRTLYMRGCQERSTVPTAVDSHSGAPSRGQLQVAAGRGRVGPLAHTLTVATGNIDMQLNVVKCVKSSGRSRDTQKTQEAGNNSIQ